MSHVYIIGTSFLAPFYLPESTSTQVETRLLGQAPGTLHISHWTRTEFASLLVRKRRMGELSLQAMCQVMARLEQHITQGAWIVSELIADDYNQATQWLLQQDTRLRALDALHLAVVERLGVSLLLTLDQVLMSKARELNIPAEGS